VGRCDRERARGGLTRPRCGLWEARWVIRFVYMEARVAFTGRGAGRSGGAGQGTRGPRLAGRDRAFGSAGEAESCSRPRCACGIAAGSTGRRPAVVQSSSTISPREGGEPRPLGAPAKALRKISPSQARQRGAKPHGRRSRPPAPPRPGPSRWRPAAGGRPARGGGEGRAPWPWPLQASSPKWRPARPRGRLNERLTACTQGFGGAGRRRPLRGLVDQTSPVQRERAQGGSTGWPQSVHTGVHAVHRQRARHTGPSARNSPAHNTSQFPGARGARRAYPTHQSLPRASALRGRRARRPPRRRQTRQSPTRARRSARAAPPRYRSAAAARAPRTRPRARAAR
jgi:hypothetical protein